MKIKILAAILLTSLTLIASNKRKAQYNIEEHNSKRQKTGNIQQSSNGQYSIDNSKEKSKFYEELKEKLESGFHPDLADVKGYTPLMYAACNNDLDAINLLIEHKADINIKDKKGWTPLCLAIWRENKAACDLLIKLGADVKNIDHIDKSDSLHKTLFIYCIESNKLKAVELLLSLKANINLTDKHGRTPLMYAAINGRKEAFDLLLDNGANISDLKYTDAIEKYNLLMSSVLDDKLEGAEFLLSLGANVNHKDIAGYTPVLYASENNNIKMLELLIKYGVQLYPESARRPSYGSNAFQLMNFWEKSLKEFYNATAIKRFVNSKREEIIYQNTPKQFSKDLVKIVLEYADYSFEDHIVISDPEKLDAFNKLGKTGSSSSSSSS